MIPYLLLLTCAVALPPQGEPRFPADETACLSLPSLVRAAGQPIDVAVGHAAPLLHDWDGDGTADLLVGQYGGGKLRVYPNGAKEGEPRLGEHLWGQSRGQADLKIPSG